MTAPVPPPVPAEKDFSPHLLTQLADKTPTDGLAHLHEAGLDSSASVEALTAAALAQAESAPEQAAAWLALAEHLRRHLGADRGMEAQIVYAQARLALRGGDLDGAADLIRQAQAIWREEDNGPALARSFLGLTQIYALQGRLAAAEESAQAAIAGLPPDSPPQAQAHINLANLLGRQGRHSEALAAYDIAQAIYSRRLAQSESQQSGRTPVQGALARLAVNRANALMALDQPEQAERALRDAARHFAEAEDSLNRGRTFTNLGTLYVRTGRYSQALTALEEAAGLLLDETAPIADQTGRLRQADVLFLERANAYVALNLIDEAIQEIEQAIGLFEATGQPYELGQSHYTLGLLHLRRGQERLADSALAQAGDYFARLANRYWQNRVALTVAALAFQRGEPGAARTRLAALLAPSEAADIAPTGWDRGLGVEARLLQSRVALALGETEKARSAAAQAAALLGIDDADSLALPHLRLQWEHLSGCIALTGGDATGAIAHFESAIRMLESQRVSLPLEEFKSAYLEDKQELYSDLVFSLLAQEEAGRDGGIAQAFAVGEQARARSLLERLAAAGESAEGRDDSQMAQGRQLRQELHWLYNQLLDGQSAAGEDGEQLAARRREIQAKEAALQRVEWKRSSLLRQAEAVDLAAFQAALAPEQQAVVYFTGRSTGGGRSGPGWASDGGEVMAFVVDRRRARLVRNLTRPDRVEELAAELRFQLGRIELGWGYVQRHRERLMSGARQVLSDLYSALVAPLSHLLACERLLLVPHGPLHQIPLHALWDGSRYLLQRYECSYAPSGSLAVHRREREGADRRPYTSWAGLGLSDEAIPAARQEVERAAARFPHSRLFLDDAANRAGLAAAAQADVLHLATHGLFRPDNPFFSALKLADGWIDVREIYRLPLAARLVVLSACESGVGRVRGGDEVIGLARGFLGAGAHSLLVSLWNVHDESAAELMDRFYYALQQGASPAASLRAAQEMVLLAGHHPYFWAPFLVIG